MTKEHAIMNSIRLWAGEHNILCFRCNVGKVKIIDRLGNIRWFDTGLPEGFPDLILLPGDGKIIFCECKTLKGKQKEDQIKFQKIVESHGYKYILARSVDDVSKIF